MFLTAHDYEVEFRLTHKHGNANCLSRLPLHTNCTTSAKPTVNTLQIGSMPVTAEHLKQATQSDPVLFKVLNYTLKGWPVQVTPDVQPFFTRQHEITAEDGCLLWGICVIVPLKLRDLVLQELHLTHPGIVRMKSLARIQVWWPNIDKDIASRVNHAMHVKQSEISQARPHSIHGLGLRVHGREYILTLQDPSWGACF